jgi:hypothetical protein
MINIRTGSLIRVTACALFCLLIALLQSYEARGEDFCITCHTDEEMLKNNLGKGDKEKSSLQAGPG